MKQEAGSRLFEMIGQIPEEMILEADRDSLEEASRPDGRQDTPQENTVAEQSYGITSHIPENEAQPTVSADHSLEKIPEKQEQSSLRTDLLPDRSGKAGSFHPQPAAVDQLENRQEAEHGSSLSFLQKSGKYLKYLPVAVCLCMVFTGAYYVINNYFRMDSMDKFSMSTGSGLEKSEDAVPDKKLAEGSQNNGSGESVDDNAPESSRFNLPVRYDAYEGPVMAMTTTGDTANLKTERELKCKVTTEKNSRTDRQDLPLLHVTDQYHIKNTSKEDKTVQFVYPFASTLNLAYDSGQDILTVHGQEGSAVKYEIGSSISAFRNQTKAGTDQTSADNEGMFETQTTEQTSSLEDYQQLSDHEGEYQKSALEKEADWEREVSVYTFSLAEMDKNISRLNNPVVAGVTVYGDSADVLTYGFIHTRKAEEGVTSHCFFVSENQSRLMLIVTGKQDREPVIGYYSNLDCTEEIEGVQYTMLKQKMSYSDALQLCTAAVTKQTMQDYDQDIYAGELPEYYHAATMYQALTMISGEEEFYHTLVQYYGSTELTEVCEKLSGETRVVYAMTTVTIPARQTCKVTTYIQKRQCSEYFTLINNFTGNTFATDTSGMDTTATDTSADSEKETKTESYGFDFLSGGKSLLNIGRTTVRLSMPEGWRVSDNNFGLRRSESVWKASAPEKSYYFEIRRKS